MASPSLLRSTTRQELYVCARCTLRASKLHGNTARRAIHRSTIEKQREAAKQWKALAKEITAGTKKSMLTRLEERGLVHSIAGKRDELDLALTENRLGAYVGIDPTASSLHVGHLLPLMSLFWMYVNGYHAVSLLGGATSKIGDPSDRLTTREAQASSVRVANMTAMHYQLKRLWVNVQAYGRKHGYERDFGWKRELVNNNTWMNNLTLIEMLQILGHGVRLGPMLARDTVKNKMSKGDGMSFAEFTYPLLQGWDWWHMYHTKGIHMQIGGSDQYGNITAGVDAVKYITKNHPDPSVRQMVEKFPTPTGFTVPLLTTAAGAKFGKSAGNAIWLDKEQTSTFDLYGFFLRTADADVERYLKLFTFLPIEQIETVVKEHMESAKERKAQHLLAREFLELIHGPEEAKAAELQHRLMFNKSSTISNPASGLAAVSSEPITLNNAPKANMKLPRTLIYNYGMGKVLYAAGLATSASEGHRLVSQQSVYIGGYHSDKKKESMDKGMVSFTPVKFWVPEETRSFLVDDKLLLLRRGKHNVRIIEVVEDQVYVEEGLSFPGMESIKELRTIEPTKAQTDTAEEPVNVSDAKFEKVQAIIEGKADALQQKDRRPYYYHKAIEPAQRRFIEEVMYKIDEQGRRVWTNMSWHPDYIISKGQMSHFPGSYIGQRIDRPKSGSRALLSQDKAHEVYSQPDEEPQVTKAMAESYARFVSAQPKSQEPVPAQQQQLLLPPKLKSLIDAETRPWISPWLPRAAQAAEVTEEERQNRERRERAARALLSIQNRRVFSAKNKFS
ncbi:tyrosine--tRNA ligase-1 [Coleophoma crateriformis]|uniref:Tyrosine--tRNA ligase n=1 Tax=Coleophoma crateriformis TaxID=565419 RepID=A0A3D8RPA2_9HELO|nr:tyrosine--tRNA ligase-1 [Coleophoma crateriformis]